MNGVDTNIFVYSLDRHEPVKRAKARILLRPLRSNPSTTCLLWQVAAEFLRQLRFWQGRGELS